MKDYKKILEGVVNIINTTEKSDIGFVNICNYIGENCPELKESKDDKIRKEIIDFIYDKTDTYELRETSNSWLAWLEKQGEQKPTDNVELKDYSSIDPHFGKPIDKVEPKFKVKYAGSEYNVFEVKDISGVTYYGIEDEPNHIDYVLSNNCEIVSLQVPAWSEEDEDYINDLIKYFSQNERLKNTKEDIVIWLKSIKSQNRWRPSDEQIKTLDFAIDCTVYPEFNIHRSVLKELLEQLKKLREE